MSIERVESEWSVDDAFQFISEHSPANKVARLISKESLSLE